MDKPDCNACFSGVQCYPVYFDSLGVKSAAIMSKRSIIIAVLAVLLFVAALFSVLMDKKPAVDNIDPGEDPGEDPENKFKNDVKITPGNVDENTN